MKCAFLFFAVMTSYICGIKSKRVSLTFLGILIMIFTFLCMFSNMQPTRIFYMAITRIHLNCINETGITGIQPNCINDIAITRIQPTGINHMRSSNSTTDLNDIIITVKTAKKTSKRLQAIFDTWWQIAKNVVSNILHIIGSDCFGSVQ